MDSKASKKKVSESEDFTKHAAYLLKLDYPNSRFNKCDARDGPQLVNVSRERYELLSSRIHQTFANCNISEIRQVYAPHMYAIYKLRYEEMKLIVHQSKVKKKNLYHVTTEDRALESLESGLDWRRTRRAKFGCGVSFSDDADYANFYSDNSAGGRRVIMICSVLVRKTYDIPEGDNGDSLIVPPGCADTTVSHNGRVYVKYNDNDFYPKYFVYYTRTSENMTESKYFRGNTRRARSMGLVGSMRAMNLY
ncbi:unnamed protein product [Macrosiphum euphorbiae]|uniref:Poly [ADP-ribose] polymerase n=1 Tax=Macrosiphum euphorbiae TaxID=13131 RepID=A0AAV0XLE5_9HEMI|nr:unnamed protein product [Macrosiphum euphorbiae]